MNLPDKEKTFRTLKQKLPKQTFNNMVLMGYRGSISHGTYIKGKSDDIDIVGVFIPPVECILGLDRAKTIEIELNNGKYDIVLHPFRKFVTMVAKSNPNVLNLLWLKQEHYFIISDIGQCLIRNREKFLSSYHCYNAYRGYAQDQLDGLFKSEFKGYMGVKRKKLVKKYGYDIRQAAHLIRLLTMGIEILNGAGVKVYREDHKVFINIKEGLWSMKQVDVRARKLFNGLHVAYTNSELSDSIDWDWVNDTCVGLLLNHIECKYNQKGK